MQELRPLAPVECEVVIYQCDEYVLDHLAYLLADLIINVQSDN